MADFVINEWLWDDASGANGSGAQKEAFDLIVALCTSGHRIVVVEGSPFEQKVWNLCKSTDVVVRSIVREFLGRIRYDLNRCIPLKAWDVVSIQKELASATKVDDHYLLQALLTVTNSILVTTDTPLREAVSRAGLRCLSREQFLSTYC